MLVTQQYIKQRITLHTLCYTNLQNKVSLVLCNNIYTWHTMHLSLILQNFIDLQLLSDYLNAWKIGLDKFCW